MSSIYERSRGPKWVKSAKVALNLLQKSRRISPVNEPTKVVREAAMLSHPKQKGVQNQPQMAITHPPENHHQNLSPTKGKLYVRVSKRERETDFKMHPRWSPAQKRASQNHPKKNSI